MVMLLHKILLLLDSFFSQRRTYFGLHPIVGLLVLVYWYIYSVFIVFRIISEAHTVRRAKGNKITAMKRHFVMFQWLK